MSSSAHANDETMPAPGDLAMGQMGMWLFLGTEVMFFAALIATYLILRSSVAGQDGSGWPTAAQVHMNPWIGLGNTAILLVSSVLVSLAVQALAAGAGKRAGNLLLLAMGLGVCFLGIKGYEYSGKFRHQLLPGKIGEVFPAGSTIARRYDQGPGLQWLDSLKAPLEELGGKEFRLATGKEKGADPAAATQTLQAVRQDPAKNLAYEILLSLEKGDATPSVAARKVFGANEAIRAAGGSTEVPVPPALPHGNLWASCYFVITGLHATHLLAGLVALAIPALAGVFGYLKPSSLGYLTNATLYWHFVDLVWIILFPLLYLV